MSRSEIYIKNKDGLSTSPMRWLVLWQNSEVPFCHKSLLVKCIFANCPTSFSRKSDVFFPSMATSLLKIVASIPQFLSPFLCKIIVALAQMDNLSKKTKNDSLSHKVDDLKEEIGKAIAPRVLLPAIDESFNQLVIDDKVMIYIYFKFQYLQVLDLALFLE